MNTTVWRLFNLRRDQDHPDAIDADIRAGSEPIGANLWVLFFAILIASVGLNVNSTAVIVGAMLISPLMGPILAIGYGAAVHDLKLIRQSGKTLLIFTTLSLITSTLYFVLSPLDQPGSELLARTSPTLWDVLIAAFGGAAGMIAATRKEASNVVPGVAIATALMPPLCTAGFGLAHGRWDLFGGAAYLFLINGVFIASATLGISKVMRLPRRGVLDPAAQLRHRVLIVLGITLVMAPSVWLGYRFVRHEVFQSGALRVAQAIQNNPQFNVVAQQVDTNARVLHLTLVGSFDESRLQELASALFKEQGLSDGQVALRRAGDAPIDLGLLKNQVQQDVDKRVVQQLQVNEAKLVALESTLAEIQKMPAEPKAVDAEALRREVRAQFSQVSAVTLAYGNKALQGQPSAHESTVVVVELTKALTKKEIDTLQRWLVVRLGRPEVMVMEKLVSKAGARR